MDVVAAAAARPRRRRRSRWHLTPPDRECPGVWSSRGGKGCTIAAGREPVRRCGRGGGQGGRPARGPDAAEEPGRGARPAAPDRGGLAAAQAGRACRADVGAALGTARHRQDHARLRAQPGDQPPVRRALRRLGRSEPGPGGDRVRPRRAWPDRHADAAVHRRGAPVQQGAAGRPAARRREPVGLVRRRDHGEPVVLGRRAAALPLAAADPAAAAGRGYAGAARPGGDGRARARRGGDAGRRGGRGADAAGRRRRQAGADLPGGRGPRPAGRRRASTPRCSSARWTGSPSATTGPGTSTTT